MRFADAPEVSVRTTVAAPPATVWAFVTDIGLPARFSPEFQGAEWLDGADGPELGARFRGRNHNERMGTWEVTCTVMWCEPGRTFGWVVGDVDAPIATWRFDLEPVAADGASDTDTAAATVLRQWARMGPGPSGVTAAIASHPDAEERIVEGRIAGWRRDMTANLDGIRALAEAAATRR
jgi:hypothetical protein